MIFRNKKINRISNKSNLKDKAATKVANSLIAAQNWFATTMGNLINSLGIKGKKIFLILFVLIFGSYSLYILLHTFLSSNKNDAKGIKPEAISVPSHLNEAGDENTSATTGITEEDLKNITVFKHYMDSLRASSSGKYVYDSIISTRPGLMDSIKLLEQIYLFQQKNK
jgi:hypothetical protein